MASSLAGVRRPRRVVHLVDHESIESWMVPPIGELGAFFRLGEEMDA